MGASPIDNYYDLGLSFFIRIYDPCYGNTRLTFHSAAAGSYQCDAQHSVSAHCVALDETTEAPWDEAEDDHEIPEPYEEKA
jgi:hypothetical protein